MRARTTARSINVDRQLRARVGMELMKHCERAGALEGKDRQRYPQDKTLDQHA